MPEGTKAENQEKTGPEEGDSEALNFRAPKALKVQLELIQEFEMTSSLGELMRSIAREHIASVTRRKEYRWWLQRAHPELVKI